MGTTPPMTVSSNTPNNPDVRRLLKDATLEIRRLREQVSKLQEGSSKGSQGAEAIAIVGMACRFPGGISNPVDYWELLQAGRDAIVPVPEERWDLDRYYHPDVSHVGAMYTREGGFLDDVAGFDAGFFGISPREAEVMDPQQRLLLEVGHQALEHAGVPPASVRGSRTGVYVGICFDDYAQRNVRSGDPRRIDANAALGNNRSVAAGRIAYIFDLRGPVMQIDTTCSSSLVTVHMACRSLLDGETDFALAGGVNLMLAPEATIGFSRLQALAKDGRCRTFAADAQGYARGEGCGMLVLTRLSDAVAAGRRIWAVIRASALNHDGASNGLTAPNGPAQTAVIRAALESAALTPDDIQYVEAHGTATPLGDPIEIRAMMDAYGARRTPLYTGTVKTNFGHLESAAGVAGLIKAALAVGHGVIPPHLHFSRPNPRIPWRQWPLHVPTENTAWPHCSGPRRAAVSGFGMSGTNAHIIVEQAPAASAEQEVSAARPWHMLTVSAKSAAALHELIDSYRGLLDDGVDLAAIACTARNGRDHYRYRRALVASDNAAMRELLQQALVETSPPAARKTPVIAFLYTGQGSQYVNMGRDLYRSEAVFRNAFDQCAVLAGEQLGIALKELVYPQQPCEHDATRLDMTVHTQPALFALQYALTELWRSWGVQPAIVLGHSVGEYAAAVQAGFMSLADAMTLICARARLMEALPEDGAMLAIDADVQKISEFLPPDAEIAVCNSAEHTVIAGSEKALQQARLVFERQGIRCTTLAVSRAFHTRQMEPVLVDFRAYAERVAWKAPQMTFVSSMTGKPERSKLADAGYWVDQIRRPVRFDQALTSLSELACDICVEIGPHAVLTAFGRMSGAINRLWLTSLRRPQNAMPDSDCRAITECLAALYEAGVNPNWRQYDHGTVRLAVDLPTYPFQRRRYWQEAPAPNSAVNEACWPGRMLALVGERMTAWQVQLDDFGPVAWSDHRVAGSTLFPLAGYLSLAWAAAPARDKQRYQIRDLTLKQALWLPQLPTQLQLQTYSQSPDLRRFECYQEEHCVAEGAMRVSRAADLVDGGRAEMRKQTLTTIVTPQAFYAQYAARRIDYGESFRLLSDIVHDGRAAMARIKAPATGGVPHPAIIDAGLQLCGLLLEQKLELCLPQAVAAFEWTEAEGDLWVYARRQEVDAASGAQRPTYDIEWLLADGAQVGMLSGLLLGSAAGEGATEPDMGWLHRVTWSPQALPASPTLVTAARVADALRDYLHGMSISPDVQCYQMLQPELETLSLAYIAAALEELGLPGAAKNGCATQRLASVLSIAPPQQAYFTCLLENCESAGLLSVAENQADRCWYSGEEWPQRAADELLAETAARFPQATAELELLHRCGTALPRILRGAAEALPILFPGGDVSLLTQLYEASSGARSMNALLKETLTRLLADWAPGQRPLRVLEIGAGTGGSSSHVLPVLAGFDGLVEYLFTDVSTHFFKSAQERFADYRFVEYERLDIEQAPPAQWRESFDLVIAANVLHATADVRQTLSHVDVLLAADGRLLLLEATERLVWLDMIFGTMPGWWKFNDWQRRPRHPLLTRQGWTEVLSAAGFADIRPLQPEAAPLAQTVFLAAKPCRPRTLRISGDGPVADTLRTMSAAESAEERSGESESLDEVMLFQYDEAVPLEQQVSDISTQVLARVRVLLHHASTSQLWLAVVAEDGGRGELIHSALWGFAQTVALEHPELYCRLVLTDSAESLIAELHASTPERHVRHCKGERSVARLANWDAAEPRQLCGGASGTLESVDWRQLPSLPLKSGEIEIQVAAAGVNFRDVLIALGEYPEPAELGAECSGEIVAIGSGVTQFKPGDHVMAIASGALATRVRVDQRLAVRLPLRCQDRTAAAALPVAYVTAAYALLELADLQPGERVLIHAAAGGVGQAAVRIALDLGAVVYATASADKQALVSRMGVASVMDSRSAGFAAAVVNETGGAGVDVVLNSLSGALQLESVDALQGSGRFIEIGKLGGVSDAELTARAPSVRVFRLDLAALCREAPDQISRQLQRLRERVDQRRWPLLPTHSYGPEQAVEALRVMQRARHTGKLVVRVGESGALPAPVVHADKVYLITGGLGDLGLAVAQWLVSQGARRLCLLTRRSQPEHAEINVLRAQGIDVDVRSLDVADRQALAALLADIETAGLLLGGIVHAAGVLDDALLAQMSDAQLQRVLVPKIAGGWYLHELTAGKSLDFFLSFASASGVLGSPGQANHAVANAFLDGLARYRRRLGLPAISIAWGAWSEIGAARSYLRGDTVSGLAGVGVINPAQGMAMLERLWRANEADIAVLPMRWPEFLRHAAVADMPLFERIRARCSETSAGAGEALMDLHRPQDVQTLDIADLETYVCGAVAQTLGFAVNELDRQAGFFELGLDSLTALELKNRLQTQLDLRLPSTLLFDYPNIDALLAYLNEQLANSRQDAAVVSPPPTHTFQAASTGLALEKALDDRLDALTGLWEDGRG